MAARERLRSLSVSGKGSYRRLQTAIAMTSRGVSGGKPVISLQQAARDGREDVVRLWLEQLPKRPSSARRVLNKKDSEGFTAMHYAARFNRLKIMQMLVDSGADPNVKADDNSTPLHLAAKHVPRATLLQAPPPPPPPPSTTTTVQQQQQSQSLSHGRTTTTSTSSDSSATATAGKSPLLLPHRATSSGRIMEYLVHHCQCHVNVLDSCGLSPLHVACSRGNLPATETLLGSPHVDVNIGDSQGDRPLHEACLLGDARIVRRLLCERSVDVLALDNEKMTPLHIACREGHTDIAGALLEFDISDAIEMICSVDNELNTPLHLACESGKVELVSLLISHGANPTAKRINSETPFHIAADQGFVEVGGVLLEAAGSDHEVVNALDSHLWTPLHFATSNNHTKMIKFLLANNAQINARDESSSTPLLLAAAQGETESFLTLMSQPGVQLDAVDKDSKNAVFLAAERNNILILETLIRRAEGPSLCSATDDSHNTPLHTACREGHPQAVTELLQSRAIQVDARNEGGKTALHLAAENGHTNVVAQLVEHEMDTLKDEDDDSNTPLHLACISGRLGVAEVLIEANAKLDARNASLWTPLDCAAASGHHQLVQLLINSDVDIDTTDKFKLTPLHLACREGHLQVVECLMQNGASVTALDQNGYNCFELAIENGHKHVAMAIVKSQKWDVVLRNCRGSATPLRRLIQKMPDVAKEVLNHCMETNASVEGPIHPWSKEYTVTFNYEFLEDHRDSNHNWKRSNDQNDDVNSNSGEESKLKGGFSTSWGPLGYKRMNHPLAIMVQSEAAMLLKHPLVCSLLAYKWKSYGRFFYLTNLLLYLVFLSFLTAYALVLPSPLLTVCAEAAACNQSLYGFSISKCSAMCRDLHVKEVLYNSTYLDSCLTKCYFQRVSSVVILTLASLHLCIKAFTFIKVKFSYLLDFVNWLEASPFLGAVVFSWTFNSRCLCMPVWQWEVGVVTVFLSWITLMTYIRRLPITGIYVLMFLDIFYILCKMVVLMLLVVVAFGLSFYMVFYEPDHLGRTQFSTPFRAMSKTLTMMMGEFEYDAIYRQSGEEVEEVPFYFIAFALWIAFLILMPILLANLLVGLAVDDIKGILEAAVLKRLALKVELILNVEEQLPRSLRRWLIVEREVVKPNRPTRIIERMIPSLWSENKLTSSENISNALNPPLEPIRELQQHSLRVASELQEIKQTVNELSRIVKKLAYQQGVMPPTPTSPRNAMSRLITP